MCKKMCSDVLNLDIFCIFAPCDWINRVFIAEKITEIPTGSCLTSAAVSRNSPGKH